MARKRNPQFNKPKKKDPPPQIPTPSPSRVKSRGNVPTNTPGPFDGVKDLQDRRNRIRKATGHKPLK